MSIQESSQVKSNQESCQVKSQVRSQVKSIQESSHVKSSQVNSRVKSCQVKTSQVRSRVKLSQVKPHQVMSCHVEWLIYMLKNHLFNWSLFTQTLSAIDRNFVIVCLPLDSFTIRTRKNIIPNKYFTFFCFAVLATAEKVLMWVHWHIVWERLDSTNEQPCDDHLPALLLE